MRVILFHAWLAIGLLAALSAAETPVPAGGKDVLAEGWAGKAGAMGSKSAMAAERADFEGNRHGWRIRVLDDQTGPYQLQVRVPVAHQVREKDMMLLTFEARCLPGSSPDGTGVLRLVVENHLPPKYPKLGQDACQLGPEWTRIFFPFSAAEASLPDRTNVILMPGGRKQALEIADLRLIDYGADFPISKLPHPYIHYPGREANAPWRKEALARIERIRTTEVAVEVVNGAGAPVAGAKVNIRLRRNAFAFGAAVRARWLMGDDPVAPKYRQIVDENFSAMVLENDLKPFAWEKGAGDADTEYRREWALGAMQWARERGFRVRGHYLCWGPWEEWSEKLREQPQAIREKVMGHLDEITAAAGGLVTEWDAVNHPVGWESPRRTVDQAVGAGFYADVFKAARARTGLPLWINEDQVFRPGRQQEEFYECIRGLIAAGARPDGIGNQAHFHSSYLPAPVEMLRISDRFAALVPQLELTEFDVTTNGDEALQADWLRDTLIMAYSHPAYTGVMLWVFWEGACWKPEAALWRTDWTEKPNAAVWKDLVGRAWRTEASGATDAAGSFKIRGHRGLYDVTVETGGVSQTVPFSTENGAGVCRIVR